MVYGANITNTFLLELYNESMMWISYRSYSPGCIGAPLKTLILLWESFCWKNGFLIFVKTSSLVNAVFRKMKDSFRMKEMAWKRNVKYVWVMYSVESLMEAFPTCGRRLCVMFAYLIWYLFTWGVMLLSCVWGTCINGGQSVQDGDTSRLLTQRESLYRNIGVMRDFLNNSLYFCWIPFRGHFVVDV